MCKNKLKEANIILCGVYCANCVKELTKNEDEKTKEFECRSCQKIHNISEGGFMRWNAFENFNSNVLPMEDIYRCVSTETLKSNLKGIEKQINEMSFSLNNISDKLKNIR